MGRSNRCIVNILFLPELFLSSGISLLCHLLKASLSISLIRVRWLEEEENVFRAVALGVEGSDRWLYDSQKLTSHTKDCQM
jgi:hypothetical protein